MSFGVLTPEQQRRVLDSALQLMSTQSLDGLTIEQLTHTSGVSAFDIIRQYQTKENILSAVLERELELIASSVPSPELRFPSETLRDEVQILAKIMLQESRTRLPFLRQLFLEAMQNSQVGTLLYRKFIQQGRWLFSEFLNIRKQRGELREDVDVEAAAALFLSALVGILLVVELFEGKQVEPFDEERFVREVANLFLDGILKR